MAWPARCITDVESPVKALTTILYRQSQQQQQLCAMQAALMTVSGVQVGLGRIRPSLPVKKNLTCSQSLAAPNHSKAKKSTFVSI